MTGNEQNGFAQTADSVTETAIIRQLNDRFRQAGIGGRTYITPGIQELGPEAMREIMNSITQYCDFSSDNDPFREHDFGSIDHGDTKVFWKIDYYDLDLAYGSPNPADPSITSRVMTVMLACEY